MTSLIDNNIDELIRRVRQQSAMSDVVFMTAYPPRELPNPVTEYTVAVNHTGIKTAQVFVGEAVGAGRKGRLYDAALVLRTYAPRHTAASALLRITALLADAIEAADTDGAVAQISLGEVVYENAARTVYRDVNVSLRYLISGEGSY